jgi:ketosteroid isomerase-like protein
VDLAGFRDWLNRYFGAWVSNDPAEVSTLFAADAEYWTGPFSQPQRGRDAIVERWTSEVQMDVRTTFEPLAIHDGTGVAHWNVRSRSVAGSLREWDGILVVTFDVEGRCREHREWFAVRDLPD